MAQRRVHPAAIAAASDGSVLINVADSLPDRIRERLAEVLGSDVFVGVALSQRDAGEVVARLDGAAAEASAQLLGGGSHPKLLAARPKKSAKSGASRARSRR